MFDNFKKLTGKRNNTTKHHDVKDNSCLIKVAVQTTTLLNSHSVNSVERAVHIN